VGLFHLNLRSRTWFEPFGSTKSPGANLDAL
jgi:hypothetical protein